MAIDVFPLGFHAGATGHYPADLIKEINRQGFRAFVKVIDDDGRAEEALRIGDTFGIENVVVFRLSNQRVNNEVEAPDGVFAPDKPIEQSADEWWQRHHGEFQRINAARAANHSAPLDKRIWFEIANETNRNTYRQQGEMFAIIAKNHTLPQGWRICAPGSNSGEPNGPGKWFNDEQAGSELQEGWAGWEEYFRLCVLHPDQLAVAIHYYDWRFGEAQHSSLRFADSKPFLVGREEMIYEVCDRENIEYPVIHVTEGGFKHDTLPGWTPQVEEWVDGLLQHMGEQPNMTGIGWWCAQTYHNSNIHNIFKNIFVPKFVAKARKWVAPPQLERSDRPEPVIGDGSAATNGQPWPASRHHAVYLLAPQSLSDSERHALYELAWTGVPLPNGRHTSGKHTVTFSHDDAFNNVASGADGSMVVIVEPQRIGSGITPDWMAENAANISYVFTRLNEVNFSFGIGSTRGQGLEAGQSADQDPLDVWIWNRHLLVNDALNPPTVTLGAWLNVRLGPGKALFPQIVGELLAGEIVVKRGDPQNQYVPVRILHSQLQPVGTEAARKANSGT